LVSLLNALCTLAKSATDDQQCHACSAKAELACPHVCGAVFCSHECGQDAWDNGLHAQLCGAMALIRGKRKAGADDDPPSPAEMLEQVLFILQGNDEFLKELVEDVTIDEVRAWFKTSRSFRDYIVQNPRFWWLLLKNEGELDSDAPYDRDDAEYYQEEGIAYLMGAVNVFIQYNQKAPVDLGFHPPSGIYDAVTRDFDSNPDMRLPATKRSEWWWVSGIIYAREGGDLNQENVSNGEFPIDQEEFDELDLEPDDVVTVNVDAEYAPPDITLRITDSTTSSDYDIGADALLDAMDSPDARAAFIARFNLPAFVTRDRPDLFRVTLKEQFTEDGQEGYGETRVFELDGNNIFGEFVSFMGTLRQDFREYGRPSAYDEAYWLITATVEQVQ